MYNATIQFMVGESPTKGIAYRFSSAIFYEQQIDEFSMLTHFGAAF